VKEQPGKEGKEEEEEAHPYKANSFPNHVEETIKDFEGRCSKLLTNHLTDLHVPSTSHRLLVRCSFRSALYLVTSYTIYISVANGWNGSPIQSNATNSGVSSPVQIQSGSIRSDLAMVV